MIVINKFIYSNSNKFVHRIGTDVYFKKAVALKGDAAEQFEEVDEISNPPTEEELAIKTETENKVKEMFFARSIPNVINTMPLTNNEKLSVKDYYPEWKVEIDVQVGECYQYDGDLWEALTNHKTQENWKPSLATASIWKRVDKEHKGDIDDPIPYMPPMELFINKYYIQNNIKYKCIRNSEQPLTHDLNALVGLYTEIVYDFKQ